MDISFTGILLMFGLTVLRLGVPILGIWALCKLLPSLCPPETRQSSSRMQH